MTKKILQVICILLLISCEPKESEGAYDVGEVKSFSIPVPSFSQFTLADKKDPRAYIQDVIVQIVAQNSQCSQFSYYGVRTYTNGSPMNLKLPENCSFNMKLWYANEVKALSTENFEGNIFYESGNIQITSEQLKSNSVTGSHQLVRTSYGSSKGFEKSVITPGASSFLDDEDADWDEPPGVVKPEDKPEDKPADKPEDTGTDERLERGRSLFLANCANASCHPTSASSTNVRARSAAAITTAIQTRAIMRSVRVSSSEINDIAYALGN